MDVKTEIYMEHRVMIYNYFLRATMNSHISEELTQDTFLKAFNYFTSFRGESSVKTWLFKIARNTFLNHVRKQVNTDDIDEFEICSSNDDYSRSDDKSLIRKILYTLTEEERTLIILRDLNGFSYSEIAGIMDFTEGKVKISLHRARKKFRDRYEAEIGEDE